MKINKKRGLLASVGALVTAVALALGGAATAQAAPTIPPTGSTANLHITKLSTPATPGAAADGRQVATQDLPTGAVPIAGVTFSAKRATSYTPSGGGAAVSLDLSTNAGWQAAGKLHFNAAAGTWHDAATMLPASVVTVAFDAATTGTTNALGVPMNGGSPAFQNLPIGLYQVNETGAPGGVTPAVPFAVTLPMTNPSDLNAWMHDVYVYPKNAKTGITKSVKDAGLKYQAGGASALVDWTILTDVPRIPGADAGTWANPTSFVISDDIEARLMVKTVAVSIVDADGTSNAQSLTSPNDYTLATSVPSTVAGEDVIVTFTSAGLGKLGTNAATTGRKVKVDINTQVQAGVNGVIAAPLDANGNAIITNGATVTTNGGQPLAIDEGAKPQTVWRNNSFVKKNQSAANLAGAEFQVFATKAYAESGSAANSLLIAQAPATSAATTGVVTLGGLIRSDVIDGAQLSTAAGHADLVKLRVYWLTETKAPVGYELLARPIPFVVLADGLHQVDVNAAGEVTAITQTALTDITNVKHNAGFTLPLTGGMGTAILTIGGIAILAIVLIVARRRRDTEANAE